MCADIIIKNVQLRIFFIIIFNRDTPIPRKLLYRECTHESLMTETVPNSISASLLFKFMVINIIFDDTQARFLNTKTSIH